MTTIFSKIIAREIPADIIYEDDVVLAFLDINPVNKGHSLIIPKQPFVNIFDGEPEVLAHMMKVGQKIALALKEAELADGVNLIMNNGEAASQEVFHSHLHVIPRLKGDKVFKTPTHVEYQEGEKAEVKNKLTEILK